MQHFLPAIPLAGAKIVVVGEGEAAIAKARLFAGSPAQLVWHVGAREKAIPADIAAHAEITRGELADDAFDGARFVFLALDDGALTDEMAQKARAAGALVNAVDRPAQCDFNTPALIERGPITIGVSSGGGAPVIAAEIRRRIETALRPGVGLMSTLAHELRDAVKERLSDFTQRRAFWRRHLRGPAADLADKGDEAGARASLRRALIAESAAPAAPQSGVVHLVGAGPGDPDLLTVRAARLLADADVIVHDRLIPEALLRRARRDAHFINVGKARNAHSVPQRDIEAILIEEARKGHLVIRLKGGDPFVFGRGGEELEALRAAGLEARVTPGVTAALACAASAGAPLTHRDDAQAVTFVTGRAKLGGPDADFRAFAAPNHTVVFYMGVDTVETIERGMLDAGRAPATPVAVIENGTRHDERVLTGSLSGLSALVKRGGVAGPAILLIGETARHARTRDALVSAAQTEAAA